VPEVPGQFWKDFIRETAPVFRTPTIEQVSGFIEPTWRALVDGARYVHPRLLEIFGELDPDVIVEDNVVAFPALPASGRRWVRIASCNPAELLDPDVPPVFSGYPAGDRSDWPAFRAEYRRVHADLWGAFDAFCREHDAPGLPDGPSGPSFIHESPFLNLYLYPADADYVRAVPLAPTWQRLESSARAADGVWQVPRELAGRAGALIYLSLGSLGSADVELMRRLVEVLGATPHRFVVSKGPQADLYDLADNMAGAEFVPQRALLPKVDLVITHGGNNTVTESFHDGRPMILLPLFWDQYDNAQRIHETGFGVRLPTYTFEPAAMTAAIDRLLADRALHARLATISTRLRANPGTIRAADLIEELATTAG
jgi:UDP:flavonoid glycosyltransferase YjiC (YdhE family)